MKYGLQWPKVPIGRTLFSRASYLFVKRTVPRFRYSMRWWSDVYSNDGEGNYLLNFRQAYLDPNDGEGGPSSVLYRKDHDAIL